MKRNARYALTGILLATLLSAPVILFRKGRISEADLRGSQVDTRVRGPADAPITIIEYSDFECPACQKSQEAVHALLTAFPGKIRLVYRHFPLAGHRFSGIAHQASECAHEEGKFWEYHDRLYAEQALWSRLGNPTETFFRYARDLGLDLDRFGSCLVDQRIMRRILLEKEKGNSLKVNSTPTFFINGERVVGPLEFRVKAEALVRRLSGSPDESGGGEATPQ